MVRWEKYKVCVHHYALRLFLQCFRWEALDKGMIQAPDGFQRVQTSLRILSCNNGWFRNRMAASMHWCYLDNKIFLCTNVTPKHMIIYLHHLGAMNTNVRSYCFSAVSLAIWILLRTTPDIEINVGSNISSCTSLWSAVFGSVELWRSCSSTHICREDCDRIRTEDAP